MKFGPGIHANHFATIYSQAAPPFAVASLARFDPALLPTAAAPELVRWMQQQGEGRDAFNGRILAELRAEGVSGHVVFVYERGAAFERRFVPFSPDPETWLAQFRPAAA